MGGQKQDSTLHLCVCRLKWFNESKGFGFLVPEKSTTSEINGRDAFVHVSALQDIGLACMGENATLECEVSMSEKGLFVETVHALIDEGDINAHKVKIPLPPEEGECYDLCGRVKWYRTDKGYGFVAGEDGKKDIFIHQTALRRNGISDEEFDKGLAVKMKVRDVDQGREVVEIALNVSEEEQESVAYKSSNQNDAANTVPSIDLDGKMEQRDTMVAQNHNEI